jgi:indolepyruvate ferredoxin oxidoreductase
VLALSKNENPQAKLSLDELIEHRAGELASYQDSGYARQYRSFVEEVRRAEQQAAPGSTQLTEAVARNLYKLMAYKDEYEVARLLLDPSLEQQIQATFEKPGRIIYHLHPPLLRALGMRRKLSLGAWFRPVFELLAAGRRLRGTAFDPFGYAAVRKEERDLIRWYRGTVGALLPRLGGDLAMAVEIAKLPEQIRGYEELKLDSARRARQAAMELLAESQRETAA